MDDKLSTSFLNNLLSDSANINEFIDKFEEELEYPSFVEYINRLIKDRGLSVPEIIENGFMNESYCYQLIKGTRKPSRNKIIQLCFALGLNLEESNKLLLCGQKNVLYVRDKRDAIIIFGINKKLSVMDAEEILLERGFEPILGSD